MNAREIYFKTMPFNWIKLGLGLATVLISAVLFAIIVGIGSLFGSGGSGIGIIIWLIATGIVRFVIMHYFGYLVKAGHVAVITKAVTTGEIPADQVNVGKQMVTERFATSNIYFAVDKLVSGAVKQLQGVLDEAGNMLNFVPGMDSVVKVGKLFISISLGYIDECCLGYTFYKNEQGAFKSAADGVVIYAQNWKVLLKNAAKTTGVVIALIILFVIIVFVLFGAMFRLLHWNLFVAFLISCMVAWAIKFAFIDGWILVKMMTTYMEVAPSTVITFDLYDKLCGLSNSFKELMNKGRQEQPSAQPAYAAAGFNKDIPVQSVSSVKPLFCGQCGTKMESGSKFCGSCGAAAQ